MAPRLSLALAACLAFSFVNVSLHAQEVSQPAASSAETPELVHAKGFVHRLYRPEQPGARVFVLLHGSGGDETTLADLARKIDPDATLIGIRGRLVQNGVTRWYRRVTPTEFDQADVRAEAAAFVTFLEGLASENGFDAANVTFLGYSNGANLIAALSVLHPGIVRKAVLLRAMPVLADAPSADLSRTRFLSISGENDRLYFPYAPKLAALLSDRGAAVESRVVAAGHGIGDEDATIAAKWLAGLTD
jgi:phospholipase/carboxylesterase